MTKYQATYKAKIGSLTDDKTLIVERIYTFSAAHEKQAKHIALAHRKNIADSFMHRVLSISLASLEEKT